MTGHFMPPMNLDVAATPWGKAMQAEVQELRTIVERLNQSTNNSDKSQNANVNVLNRQVGEIASAVEAAATAEEVANLAGSVAQLALDARVQPVVDNASSTSFTLTTGGITVISRSISVPSGFTRALVMSTGTLGTTVSGSDNTYGIVTINGNSGPQAASMTTSGLPYGIVSPSHAVSLTGLSGSFTVTLQGRVQAGPAINFQANATLTTMALFLP